MKRTIIHGSWGDITVTSDGKPTGPSRVPLEYRNIIRFNLRNRRNLPNEFDILDLGYWFHREDGSIGYEPKVGVK